MSRQNRIKRVRLIAIAAIVAGIAATAGLSAAGQARPPSAGSPSTVKAASSASDTKAKPSVTETNAESRESAAAPAAAAGSQSAADSPATADSASPFPRDDEFVPAADSAVLQLRAHPKTGHFIVIDKRNGNVFRSYPDPEGWNEEEAAGAWKTHMQSALLVRYVELNSNQKNQVKDTNLLDQKGAVAGFELTEGGFKLTFAMPAIGFAIPVEVRLQDDFVETRIVDEGVKDGKTKDEMKEYERMRKNQKDPNARISGIRLYPFLGADTSDSQDGYLFVPDGPGMLVRFQNDRPSTQSNYYNERVYGEDWAFSNNRSLSIRKPVRMPVFGIKSGDRAMLAVIRDGAEYASVVAAPSRSFGPYNWIAAEHGYRFPYFQPTNTRKTEGFLAYAKDRTESGRSVRYYFLGKAEADYVGMASRYRKALLEEEGMRPLQPKDANISLQIGLLGADEKKGFLFNSYMPLTTTEQAVSIIDRLTGQGVARMSILYTGWQKGGNSDYGGQMKVDHRIGGSEGMKELAAYARKKNGTVTLDGSFLTFNNTGANGFRKSRDGLRDLGSVIIGDSSSPNGRALTFVSPRFSENYILRDLDKVKALGVDGIAFSGAVGSMLNSDYNDKYAATRQQAMDIQETIMRKTKETFGRVDVADGNFYALKHASNMLGLQDEYSFDLFADSSVPFAQIALHGLVGYSSGYANMADNYREYLLKSIEYGAVPSFLLTYEQSQSLLKTVSLDHLYSTYYADWADDISSAYKRFNAALGDVQDQFIVGHRQLDDGIRETRYAGGKRIVVNYNDEPYRMNGLDIPAKDFIAIEGGK
ncbi:DUF5696 domain-containing protein [Paenibacillus spongiae]|uniref:DUF5696 domain-containing protein n=1 Tax=Paenibacillus spongiae TaxID=2909671 RepID=A0ABY5S8D9_9BACL|nr:DUF5696 domain-containing protein [Paenibacillus spongiae]UVI30187.1 DUF5696 domain-containing protein [Paenibacillus spongiae]